MSTGGLGKSNQNVVIAVVVTVVVVVVMVVCGQCSVAGDSAGCPGD